MLVLWNCWYVSFLGGLRRSIVISWVGMVFLENWLCVFLLVCLGVRRVEWFLFR